MSEQPPKPPENAFDKKPEQFPSKEEIRSVFKRFLKDKEYSEISYKWDDQGVVVYEIESTDKRGDKVEYNFQRAKYDYRDPSLPKTTRFSASIQVTFYTDGEPVGGDCVANYLDGKWEYPE